MRIFRCDRCATPIEFAALRCTACGVEIGYVPDQLTMRSLDTTAEEARYQVAGDDQHYWRCLNAAWGCNWMLPTGSGTWCRSCATTRGRPDEGRPGAIDAWMAAEAAKRRVIHQLDELALAFEVRSPDTPDGLAFDFVHIPSAGGITGHLEGVVTLDLAEVDELHRGRLRRDLDETYRTVIGHLRHEIGHYFWGRLVGQSDDLERFRQLFGNERIDYGEAIERHYAPGDRQWDRTRFVTAYASVHPSEDWAETFAHYLHILDATGTAIAHDLVPAAMGGVHVDRALGTYEFSEILDIWRPINAAVNAIAESLGSPEPYPFDPAGAVADKLAFVHRQVTAHAERDRFYAVH
jgi:hypothetical protein